MKHVSIVGVAAGIRKAQLPESNPNYYYLNQVSQQIFAHIGG